MASTPPGRPRILRVSRSLSIPLDELQWRFTTGGGPGGQHANKASTRVELVFDVESSPSLGPRQRARLLEMVGPSVRVVSREHRSQALNRDEALRRLADKLADALHIEPVRRPTAPSVAARARRLEEKRHQAERKKGRARGRAPDDW
ncbi:MAG TPA: alternative ribosome rescue aminoacyl-tRNA hydrolase ArfB [Acidimicrobiales bacterium]|nr:alternative ribosome rescue aminoacyl-tRNA hydrolase ArfB [Acidimicrobiales bacterium]